MSRIVNIKGKVDIRNLDLANAAIKESGLDIKIQNNQFVFEGYDYYDGINKDKDIENVEKIYFVKYNEYVQELEEKERLRIEKEKELLREEKYNKIIENAKKQGYKVKKEKRIDNTIKLVLQKRVY